MDLQNYLLFVFVNLNRFTTAETSIVVKGSTVQLICPDKGNSRQWIIWMKGYDNSFKTYASATMIYPDLDADLRSRLQVTGDQAAGEYHLNISNVRQSDEGTYRCLLSGTTGEGSIQQLTVIIGPTTVSLDNLTPDKRIPGIEGQYMTIKCTAVGGHPAPDIKLGLLGSTYTGKQSIQYTFMPNSSIDGSTVTCQTGYTDVNYYPLTISAHIHLKLKAVITVFSPDTLNTEETRSFDVSCHSTGSRPAASMYWLLGQQNTNITSNSSTQSTHNPSADVYAVSTNLKYRVDRRYNGQKLICRASNVAGSMETSVTLNVKYAPGVTVENKTISQTQSLRQIRSILDSNPAVNSCNWHHRSKYGEYIRQFSANNLVLSLPTVPEDQRYQDTGEYVCTSENGIVGINGQIKQTGSGYVISNARPVITADNKHNSTQYGKFGKSTKVYVNVYSIPKYTMVSWYIGNTQLVSIKYAINEEPAIVKDVFHDVEVHLDGYRVALSISNLQEADFANYTLRLYHSTGSQYVQHKVILQSASEPETPSNFTITGSGESSITVQWIPGYDGGQTQTFYIEYRITGSSIWLPQEVKNSNQFHSPMVYTFTGFRDKTSYDLRMYARNEFNQSHHTDIETIRTLKSEGQTSSNVIIGTVAGVLVVFLIVCAVIITILIIKKRKGKIKAKKNAGFYENSGFQNVQIGDEYDEVISKADTQEKQTSKTYEALRTNEAVDVYDDLEDSKGLPSAKSTSTTYESLGTKDAVAVYDDLNNHKDLPSSKPSVDHPEALGTQDKPNVYEELENQKGQEEKVYVNEAF